jgi:hypothetical protein
VILFLWAEGVRGAEIHQRLSTQYGDSILPQRSVYKWIDMFRKGQTSVTDKERSGHPSIKTTEGNIEQVCVLILENRRVTASKVAN